MSLALVIFNVIGAAAWLGIGIFVANAAVGRPDDLVDNVLYFFLTLCGPIGGMALGDHLRS